MLHYRREYHQLSWLFLSRFRLFYPAGFLLSAKNNYFYPFQCRKLLYKPVKKYISHPISILVYRIIWLQESANCLSVPGLI